MERKGSKNFPSILGPETIGLSQEVRDMAKRRRIRVWMFPKVGTDNGLLLLGVCFVFGSLIGTLLVARFWTGGEASVSQYLNEWALGLEEIQRQSFDWLTDLVHHLRFPVAVLLFGFVPIGVGAIPVLFFVRGVLISFTVSSFLKLYAWRGMAATLLLYGPAELAGLLLQFVVGVRALRMAQERAFSTGITRRSRQTTSLRPGLTWGMGVLGVSLLQSALTPWTMGLIAQLLSV